MDFHAGASTAFSVGYQAHADANKTVIFEDTVDLWKKEFAFFTPEYVRDLLKKNLPEATWIKQGKGEVVDYVAKKDGAEIAEAHVIYHVFEKGQEGRYTESDTPCLSIVQ